MKKIMITTLGVICALTITVGAISVSETEQAGHGHTPQSSVNNS